MARKTQVVTISAEGRDQGKVFLLRELPASRAEKWATRAFLAMARSGLEIPDNIAQSGLQGIAMLGLKALGGMAFEDAEPLMDEMFGCISVIPDPTRPEVVRALIEDDIEEVETRLHLRKEVLQLHVNFSLTAAPSTSDSAMLTGDSTPNT